MLRAARGGAMRVWLTTWVVLLGLWLVLVGSLALAECLGGLVAATIGATGLLVVQTRDTSTIAVRPGWLWLLARRVPRQMVEDCARVLGVLVDLARGRRVEGRMRVVPFKVGTDAPLDAGRRALVVFGVSLAPNAVAVRFEDDALVLHQLVPSALPNDPEWPL